MNQFATLHDALMKIAGELEIKAFNDKPRLTPEDREALVRYVFDLRRQCSSLLTLAAKSVRDDLAAETEKILAATQQAKDIAEKLAGVTKGINLAVTLIATTAALIAAAQTGNIGSVAAAGKVLYDLVKEYSQ